MHHTGHWLRLALLSIATVITPALTQATSVHNPVACLFACRELFDIFPQTTLFGHQARLDLWSLFQAREVPYCRLLPSSAEDIGTILSVVRLHGCRFAVLGGGTSAFQGAATAANGVTIDLRHMKQLRLLNRNNESLISIGAGSLWADVYRYLDTLGLSAAGTRNSLTGVAGSILGGGISFFSRNYGLPCDAVVEMEIVLANSSVVIANADSHPQLFRALRGGGNNFGIVSNIVIEVFPNPPEWYNFQVWDVTEQEAVLRRLETRTRQMPANIWQIAITLQWHVPTGTFLISERQVSTAALQVEEEDAVGATAKHTYSYQRSVLQMSQKMDIVNPPGVFNFFGSVTVRSGVAVLVAIAHVFTEAALQIIDLPGMEFFIVYNPVTHETIRRMQSRGGNALGIPVEEEPLIIININLKWKLERDTEKMRLFMRELIRRFRDESKRLGVLHPYIFQNHAFEEQDVFSGYGEDSKRLLHAVREEVDPDSIFQVLQPGYFKLG